MWDIVSAYCIAIGTLIRQADVPDVVRAKQAVQALRDYSQKEGKSGMIAEWLEVAESLSVTNTRQLHAHQNDLFGNETYNVETHMGFVKHAFVLAIYCLMRAQDKPIGEIYDWAIAQCVKLQGDTDTNAAIVGGLIGAYVGISRIDTEKLRKVLECTNEKARRQINPERRTFLMPGHGCID